MNSQESRLTRVRKRVTTVLPDYNIVVTKYLGIMDIVIGVLMLIFGGTAIAIHSLPSTGSSALIAGVPVVVCGILGILGNVKFTKQVWLIVAFMVLSICCLALSLTLIGAAIVGFKEETERDSHYSLTSRHAVDAVCVVLGAAGTITTVVSTGLCTTALYFGCCRRRSGVQYVTDASQQNANNINQEAAEAETNMDSSLPAEGAKYGMSFINHGADAYFSNNNGSSQSGAANGRISDNMEPKQTESTAPAVLDIA